MAILNTNSYWSPFTNQIIRIDLYSNIATGGDLVDYAREGVGIFGDTILKRTADIIPIKDFVPYSNDATNILATAKNDRLFEQAFTINVFKYCETTVDELWMGQAMTSSEGLASTIELLVSMLAKAKDLYDATIYTSYLMGVESNKGDQQLTWNLKEGAEAQSIAYETANLISKLKRPSRRFNDYGNMTKFADSDIKFIWNPYVVNEVNKEMIPALYHDGFMGDVFGKYQLNAEGFTRAIVLADDVDNTSNKAKSGVKVVLTKPMMVTYTEAGASASKTEFILASMPLPADATIGAKGSTTTSVTVDDVAVIDDDIICKVVTKFPPFISSFVVQTESPNQKNSSTNEYLKFGHNTLDYYKGCPIITVRKGNVVANPKKVLVVNDENSPVPTEVIE